VFKKEVFVRAAWIRRGEPMDAANAKKYILATIQAYGRKGYVNQISQGLLVYCVGELTDEPEPRGYEVEVNRFEFAYGRTTHKCVINWTRGEFPSMASMIPVGIDTSPIGVGSAAPSHDSGSVHEGTVETRITTSTGNSESVPATVDRSVQTSNEAERNSMDDTRDGQTLGAITIPVSADTTDRTSLEQPRGI
jgi:hypothetical protein